MPEVRFYHVCAALPGTGVRPKSDMDINVLISPGSDSCWRSEWKRISEFPFYGAYTWPRSCNVEGATTPSKRIEAALRSCLHSRWQVEGNWRLVWWFHKNKGRLIETRIWRLMDQLFINTHFQSKAVRAHLIIWHNSNLNNCLHFKMVKAAFKCIFK